MKTILAPVDFSAASEAVLQQSIELARALGGRVVLLTVIQPPVITNEYSALMENIGEVMAAGERNAARRLAELEARVRAAQVPVETLQLNGAPVRSILEQAARLSADYLVMGSHGHTAFYDLLVGSTTHGVLLRAPCPVVITPGPKAAKPTRAA
jgi:nucleotide-binding universal stress UspA family protein